MASSETISSSKISPLDSEIKYNNTHDLTSRGAAGTDHNIDQSRIEPIGGSGHYQNPAPHADSQGVIGRDESFHGTKIDPLAGGLKEPVHKNTGLDDEYLDSSNIAPQSRLREEMKP